jgi:putative DNA methylase
VSVTPKRKLIEVALPLEAMNRESAREKSIRHGHPSTLHLWWARRPLATARAVIFAQLVDDPSSHPEEFPTEEAQRIERSRLHRIIERLVVWENIGDQRLFAEAQEEIRKSTNGNPPPILDPFAGGGTIPLEAQRLGLKAQASDLNPVAVLINKALIEIPPKFRNQPPVFPGLAGTQSIPWTGTAGLAADVRAYGGRMRDDAERRIGHLYPKATLTDGTRATVVAWIWARTVTCPNPACGIEMPLVKSWWLAKKRGKEAFVLPSLVVDTDSHSGKRVEFAISHDISAAPTADTDGTIGRSGATCIACESTVDLTYLRVQGHSGGLGARLIAVVAEGKRKRNYVRPTVEHELAAEVARPIDAPDGTLSTHPQYMGAPRYGMGEISELFTGRQLVALMTFSDLVGEIRATVLNDALASGMASGERLDLGGLDAEAYADSIATYLGFGVSKATDYHNALCAWRSDVKNEGIGHLFSRQAIPMVWDYCEANPLSASSGNLKDQYTWIAKAITNLAPFGEATVTQADASTRDYTGAVVSTDPPYYDNVPYADLSDFFYVWLRRSLQSVMPGLLSTMLVPKAQELVANYLRQDGPAGAKEFFESGFRQVFDRVRRTANPDYPMTVYYAFKQAETTAEGTASSGWETLLEGLIRTGWSITATWPVRSEMANRMRSLGSNALASSIVLALRPRDTGAPTTDRRGLIQALQAELPTALRELQQGAIAPVDLPQAAIGPGMAVFSRYASVIESDGSTMTVSSALARINEILDQVLNEQEGDFDPTTRFAIAWYRQYGYSTGQFGEADSLARARNISIDMMARDGILTSAAGKVTLLAPDGLPADYEVLSDPHTSSWEALHYLIRILEVEGVSAAGSFLGDAVTRPDGAVDADLIKELAFLLFAISEKNSWTKDAISFNTLATSWPEILDASRSVQAKSTRQGAFDFEEVN